MNVHLTIKYILMLFQKEFHHNIKNIDKSINLMISLPTFWQRWGTTAKSVLDTAVTNIGYSSKKCRIKSDFIDRVIATSRCHFTSFSSFLNDFSFSRFFFFLCLRLCFVTLLLLTQLLTDGVQSYQAWL